MLKYFCDLEATVTSTKAWQRQTLKFVKSGVRKALRLWPDLATLSVEERSTIWSILWDLDPVYNAYLFLWQFWPVIDIYGIYANPEQGSCWQNYIKGLFVCACNLTYNHRADRTTRNLRSGWKSSLEGEWLRHCGFPQASVRLVPIRDGALNGLRFPRPIFSYSRQLEDRMRIV